MGSLGEITLFGFDLFTHNNTDSGAASLDIPSSKNSLIPKLLKRPRRRRGKGGGEEGEEGDEEVGVAGDGEEFEGFSGEWADWRCFSSGSHSRSRSQSQQKREGLSTLLLRQSKTTKRQRRSLRAHVKVSSLCIVLSLRGEMCAAFGCFALWL